jgi:hypothetical protein
MEDGEMDREISRLEQAWLEAETMADEARIRVQEASRQFEVVRKQAASEDLTILLSTVESAKARHEAAEQMACDLFDRLWQAKGQGTLRSQSQEQMNA